VRPPYYGQDNAAFGQPKPANAPATWAHLGALLTWAAGFAFSPFAFFCFVAPFIIRSKWKNDPFVRHHTTQSLNSALTGLALFLVTLGLEPLAGRWVELVAISFGIARAVCEIIGAVKAHKGEEFRFPAWVAFRFIKDEPPALSLRTRVAAGVACAAALVLTPLTLLAGGTSATHFQPADARNVNPPSGSCEIAYPLGGTGLNMEVVVTYPTGDGSTEPCSAQQSQLDSISGLEGVFVPGTYAKIGVPASCSGTLEGGAVAYAAFVISPSGYSDVFCAGVQG
jgi:uncharacterized Tic20 family protein